MQRTNRGSRTASKRQVSHARRTARTTPRTPAPETASSLNNRAYRLQKQGRHAEAIPLLRRAVAKSPGYAYAQYNLGWALLETGNAREAIGPLRRSAALQPSRWEPQLRLAEAYKRLGDSAKAQQAYSRMRDLRGGRRGARASTNRRTAVSGGGAASLPITIVSRPEPEVRLGGGWRGSTDRREEAYFRARQAGNDGGGRVVE